jgi:cytochrome c nitrite reductase small subunit
MSKLPIIIGSTALVVVLVIGMYVTDFTAYMGSDPATCNNCHVMDSVYEGWFHGGHRQAATCSDCHTPHAFIPKYLVKAESGYHHVSAFMLGKIPDAIRPRESSLGVTQENCIRCHEDTVESITMGELPFDRYCWDCHRNAGHDGLGTSVYPYQDIYVYP